MEIQTLFQDHWEAYAVLETNSDPEPTITWHTHIMKALVKTALDQTGKFPIRRFFQICVAWKLLCLHNSLQMKFVFLSQGPTPKQK